MKKIKVLFVVVVTMSLLVIIAILPILLSKWNDNRMLAQVTVEKIDEKDILSLHTSKLSTQEKIKLLYDYSAEGQNYVYITQQIKSKEDYDKIRGNIAEEIKKLQNLQIISAFDFNDSYENNTFNTITYAKATDPESCVVLMMATFLSEEGYLEVWLDGNDNTIYRCHYVEKKETDIDPNTFLNKNVLLAYGMDYLGLSKEETYNYCIVKMGREDTNVGLRYL